LVYKFLFSLMLSGRQRSMAMRTWNNKLKIQYSEI
jgi:hypothetical protein